MSLPRYPKYKPSGVEWLGEVPAHWEVLPLKRSFGIVSGSTPKSDVESLWDGEILWATPADLSKLTSLYVNDTERKLTGAGLDSCGASIVPKGSIILSTRAPIGSLAIANTSLCTNQGCRALLANDRVDPLFFAHLLTSCTEELNARGKGTTFLEISADALGAFATPLPPLKEQIQIATFLDREMAKIDGLVAEQQRLIDLLKEKRQAVISHAVNKGLNPNAPMKDSGVEWMGAIPSQWQSCELKRVATVNTGVAKGKEMGDDETIAVPYLRVANVQDGYLDLEVVETIEIRASELERYALRAGDVLMNEGGDFDKLGRGCVWRAQIEPCITQNHVFAVRPVSVDPDWLSAVTSSDYAQFYFMSQSKQSTNLASISSTNLMLLPLAVPPTKEQRSIVEYLEGEASRLATLMSEAQRAITLLQERRTALISAAVTGQIDVRAAAERATA